MNFKDRSHRLTTTARPERVPSSVQIKMRDVQLGMRIGLRWRREMDRAVKIREWLAVRVVRQNHHERIQPPWLQPQNPGLGNYKSDYHVNLTRFGWSFMLKCVVCGQMFHPQCFLVTVDLSWGTFLAFVDPLARSQHQL